jgi:multisubunit Na+/H+ antiporter MnhC subunit
MARALYWVLPNFEILNLRDLAIHEKPIPWDRVLTALTYGLSYTAVVLGAAVAVFERRDLK